MLSFRFARRAARPAAQARPSVEALETRALLNASEFVRGLYGDVLHRAATDSEVNSWVQRIQAGMRKEDVTHAFVECNEHRAFVVNDDYMKFLGRPADPQGRDFWVRQMAAGMREDQVETTLLASAEYRAHHGGTDDGLINALYVDELHRGADDAGRTFWEHQLAAGTSQAQIASAFVHSHEAHLRDVDRLYVELLHRQADDFGRNNGANALDHGAREFQLMESFCDSTEYGDDHGGFDG